MTRDYSEFRKKIRSVYLRLEDFAKDMNMATGTLSHKISGKSEWSRAEIEKAAELLDLTPNEILHYFF